MARAGITLLVVGAVVTSGAGFLMLRAVPVRVEHLLAFDAGVSIMAWGAALRPPFSGRRRRIALWAAALITLWAAAVPFVIQLPNG
ncbi:MAG: hypothetical protein HY658_13705 [Actinobacteria bacterium]|nr:hypothetical protein [Actinomycetota bacterium]